MLALLEDGARLLTLTGPGGSGKTRLAIEAAAELVPEFKAGVFWVGLAAAPRPGARHRDDRADARRQGRPGRAHRRARAAAPARQPRAGGRGRARAGLAGRGLPEPAPARHQPRAAAGAGRGRVPGLAARRAGGGRALLRPGAQLEPEETDPRALPRASTTCRSRSSWPPPGRACSPRRRSSSGSRSGSTCSRAAGTPIRASRRCARRSSGATSCSRDDEQRLFARLAVFAGGCTLEAAEEVAEADLDTLQSLVDKSLLRHTERALLDAGDDPRVRGRAARRRLGRGRVGPPASLRAVHLRLAERNAEPELRGGDDAGDRWLGSSEARANNIRRPVMGGARRGSDALDLRLCRRALHVRFDRSYWTRRRKVASRKPRSGASDASPPRRQPPAVRARALRGLSVSLVGGAWGSKTRSWPTLEEALALVSRSWRSR